MKKLLGLMLGLLIVLTGCGGSSDDQGKKLDQIKENGTIVIGTNSGYPPYEFYDTTGGKKTLAGYDIDLGNAIGKKLGVKVEWKDMDFDALVPSLASGQIDIVLAGMVDTEERREAVDFTEAYYNTQTVAVAPKEKLDSLNSADKLNGKKIVVQVGTTQADAASGVKGVEVTTLPGVSDTIANLTSGQSDVLFIAEVSAKNIVAKYPDLAYSVVEGIDDKLMFDGASIALEQKQNALKSELDALIKELKDSGELDKMFNKNVELFDKINK
ncbi:ABC-type amino acid transport substrate-binding protein [Bacilli bacterium PM5-3]|nr:ABC-type amino acid transport substrate-binding protein [Bacilli bacterium PM5-3]